jgi:ATP-dependent exoDNAse (exonuclease V) beta subunit
MTNPYYVKEEEFTYYSTRHMPRRVLERLHKLAKANETTLERVVLDCIEAGLSLAEQRIRQIQEVLDKRDQTGYNIPGAVENLLKDRRK